MPGRISWLGRAVCAAVVCVGVVSLGQTAETIQLLNHYDITGDLDDVVHLGDQYDMSHFVRIATQGETYSRSFDLASPPEEGGDMLLHLELYEVDYNANAVYINGTLLGHLGYAPREHWIAQEFYASSDLLEMTGNTLSISTSGSGNKDDFEFTNLYLAYDVPEPATLSLLALGGLALIQRRRRTP